MERWIIEIAAICMAVDHGPAESEIANTSFEFVGGGLWILHRKMREAGISIGAFLDLFCEKLVGVFRLGDCNGNIALDLHAGPRQRQHRSRASSIAPSRSSPKSNSCSASRLAMCGGTVDTVPFQYPSRPGHRKCSSRAIFNNARSRVTNRTFE
jgi:hypothetical protein